MCLTVSTTQYGNEENKVSTPGRVVLCKFWIHVVSNFSSPSAQRTVIPAAATEPFLLRSYFPLPLPTGWHYWCTHPTPGSSYLLLTYSKTFEQEPKHVRWGWSQGRGGRNSCRTQATGPQCVYPAQNYFAISGSSGQRTLLIQCP